MNTVLAQWEEQAGDNSRFNGPRYNNTRTSKSEKWRYWRCDMEDGSKISVNIQAKLSGGKCLLAINHDKLNNAADVKKWRAYWKSFPVQK